MKYECCKKEENLVKKDGIKVCKVCGRRHFEMTAAPVGKREK